MKCVYGISLLLLLVVAFCQASPVTVDPELSKETDSEDAVKMRERRQMKPGNAAQPEVKLFNNQATQSTVQGAGLPNSSAQQMQPLNNLQYARYPQYAAGLMMGSYGGNGLSGIPTAGYPLAATAPGFNQAYPGSNLPGAALTYPANMNLEIYAGYPAYMFGGGAQVYPAPSGQGVPSNFVDLQNGQQNFGNMGNLGNLGNLPNYGSYGNVGSLDNLVNLVNMQGLQPQQGGSAQFSQQLVAQQSQLQPQIGGYPLMQGYYPQMGGYGPAFQNYQG